MRLNLSKIIEMPGSSLPFSCELDTKRLITPSVIGFDYPPRAEGLIRNTAGALELGAVIDAATTCLCDRCSSEFKLKQDMPVSAHLAAELEDEENPDIFLLDGVWLDVSEVLETLFILNMEIKSLCREDCAGLCSTCGANLNDGDCDCRPETDPRLAVLGQLLDIEEK